MSRSNYAVRPDSEFDSFLFANVGEDENGTDVSVLSALVRLEMDPWHEASELAQLPNEASERRLMGTLARLDTIPLARSKPGTIATRLLLLLPDAAAARREKPGVVKASNATSPRFMITWMIVMVIAFAIQALISGGQQPPSSQVPSVSASTAAASGDAPHP